MSRKFYELTGTTPNFAASMNGSRTVTFGGTIARRKVYLARAAADTRESWERYCASPGDAQLQILDSRSRMILEMKYAGKHHDDIARYFNISPERVRQIARQALLKIA